ncbi:MAG: hypothetical protein WEE89_20890 [Gemmatimonadota bacterium]
MIDESAAPELETGILTIYRGPLEEFVSRRDALAKQLRANKRREDADQVKALRKPSRTAWVLDYVVVEDAAPLERLAAAITSAQQAQSRGGADLRTALESVRTAVRDLAHAAARASIRIGHPIESTVLVAAVNAVIGDATAFADLRAGRLVEIPEGGGLDFLTAITVANTSAAPMFEPPTPPTHDAEQTALRADLKRVEAALAEARQRSQAAERAVRDAQAKHDAAEELLQRAKEESTTRRGELDRARQHEKAAVADVQEAHQAVTGLRGRIQNP